MMCSLVAGEFAPPNEGPVAFRRDRIPLEVDAMVALSGQLESLADGLDAKKPQDRRGVAQMLALALTLDPGNAGARKMLKEYTRNLHQPAGDDGGLEKCRAEIRKMVAWLETPGAGVDGQALAACLKDVVSVSESKPLPAGEQGAWSGWIPDVSAYETQAVLPVERPKEPDSVVERPVKNPILLERAEVQIPLWEMIRKGYSPEWALALGPLQMTATKENRAGGESLFSIVIGNHPDRGALDRLGGSLKVLLENQHGEQPSGLRIRITSREFELSLKSKQRQSISAAAAVLASSALTGREPEAIIIGQMNENGAFELPSRFWYQLQALGKGTGQRLVLPAAAAPYLSSILAMERPEFFLEYEVLLASDFKQLLDLTAKVPDEPLASATAKFREIRERAGAQDFRTYLANSFVKQRLALVLQDLPSHASAKMLLIQASGKRPSWVSREVLAAELRRSLEPMAWILSTWNFAPDSKAAARLGETYDICRSKMDDLEHYAEKSDRALFERGGEVVVALRNLEKATRPRGEYYMVMAAVQSARADFVQLYTAMIEQLAIEVGDRPPAPKK